MTTRRQLQRAATAALRFVAEHQTSYGEIAAYRHANPQLEGPRLLDSSPFTSTFALHALQFVEHPLADWVRGRAVRFLQQEREGPGLWRYWTSRAGLPIDPDLDDTCCASFVLRHAEWPDPHPAHARRRPLDNIESVMSNRNDEGLFKTWLREADSPNDIDPVVNANVLLYLGDRPQTAAAARALVGLVEGDDAAARSHYYLDPLALHHAVSRAFHAGARSLAASRPAILRKLAARWQAEGSWGSALATALAVCTLLNCMAPDAPGLREGLAHLLAWQQPDGGFARTAFYAGPEPPAPHSVYWGSEELSTSLCLEALSRCATWADLDIDA